MRRLLILPLLLCLQAAAQAPPDPKPQLQLSPQAAYDQANRPLDIVRRSVDNWSDPELAALAVGIKQAAADCDARTPEQFTGEDLLAFARLCAYGQMWQPVQQSATYYLVAHDAASPAEKLTNFPGLAMAYDYEIQASLQLKDTDNAIQTAHTMLSAVPYDDLAAEATNLTIRYIQLNETDEALAILAQRQPLLLALIKARAAPAPIPAASQTARPPLPLYTLYADAIALPAMQQFAAHPKEADASFAALEAALPAILSPDDAIFTAQSRRQYQLLGSPVPVFATSAWLLNPTAPAPYDLKKNSGDATVLFLFPDWCAQCVAMGPKFAAVATRLNLNHVHFYALLAEDKQEKPVAKPATPKTVKPTTATKPTPHVDVELTPKTVPELLAETPTLVVPTDTLASFAATDFPLIIVADKRGIIRAVQLSPDNALVPNGFLEQVVYHVVEHWPPTPKP